MVLMLGDDEFAFSDFRFDVSVDEDRMELDLVVAHPAFAELDDDTRGQVGFLGLDNILGEEEVERWIGGARVERARRRAAASARSELRSQVDRLAAAVPSGEWAVLRGEDAIVIAARPLRPVDHPYFDELCELTADVGESLGRAAGPRGGADRAFPASAPSTPRASRATASGPRSSTSIARSRRRPSSAPGPPRAGYAFHCSHDPGWDAVRPFR